ncbi:hypothetical protein GALMADRAFT_149050 [Galerina marginata CBS 339.88]|uniref:Uncharacterized protein n=1 Tax=Galerina marginata (strain CBS 339.88) TaxID=685588 RepID=A0A067S575_GALM3|nr:hypothetical protein GALMADRAFT_149050 [Galerina marginata CBS 339.88]
MQAGKQVLLLRPTEFRKLSLVLSAFPWATPHIIQVPKPLTDFTTILPRHKHFFDALHRFECSLFRLGQNVINNTALAPLIGLDLKKYDLGASSTVVSVHPKGTLKVSSKSDYVKLCSILCAYRTFEILALDSEISILQPPIRLLPPLSLPKFDHDSEKLIGFDKLDDWPKVLLDFRTLMAQSGPSQPSDKVHAGSKHLTLLRMTSQNGQKMKYVNLVDNFLQAALHLFYLKMVEFPTGSLPDYPDLLNDHLRIFKDETSMGHFIEDPDEGNHYLREIRRTGGDAGATTIHQLGTPLLLALLLSPFYLLFQFCITKRSFNRRLILEAFAGLSPYKTPLVVEIERSIWRSLISLADATITPHEALSQLLSDLPWPAIEAASNNYRDRRMFCMPPVIAQPSPFPTVSQPTLHLDRQVGIHGVSTTPTQVGGPTPSVKTTSSLSLSETPFTNPNSQLSMSTRDSPSLGDGIENKARPSRPLVSHPTSTSNSADCTPSASNTSHEAAQEALTTLSQDTDVGGSTPCSSFGVNAGQSISWRWGRGQRMSIKPFCVTSDIDVQFSWLYVVGDEYVA